MTDFFYSLPVWSATILVLALALAVGIGSSVGLNRLLRLKATDEEKEVAINLMQVVAAYVGFLIAFAGVQVWQDYIDARSGVSHEAATAEQLYLDLTIYGSETAGARQALRSYVASIVEVEWPRLEEGSGSEETEAALQDVFTEVARLDPQDERGAAIYGEMLDKLNSLVESRHDRIIESQIGVPMILWTIALVGSLLTVAYASAFTPSRSNVIMIGGISLTLGLVFLFILTVDHPFKGQFSVSKEHLVELPQEFDRLDRRALAAGAQ